MNFITQKLLLHVADSNLWFIKLYIALCIFIFSIPIVSYINCSDLFQAIFFDMKNEGSHTFDD